MPNTTYADLRLEWHRRFWNTYARFLELSLGHALPTRRTDA